MRPGWRAALGVVLSAVLIYWTLHGISPAEVARQLSQADPLLFAGATFCATAIFALRARRWQTILEPVAAGIPMGPLWRATAIGMMVNNVVPARAGELARAYALTKETAVPFATALASLAVDRLFDAIDDHLRYRARAIDTAALEIGRYTQRQWCYGRSLSISALSAVAVARCSPRA